MADRKSAQERFAESDTRVRELEAKLEGHSRDFGDLDIVRQRITEEINSERSRHQKDLAEREFTLEQTRKKYQST